MSDLINRADAIEAVCGVVIDEFDVSPTVGYEVAEKALSALPSADAVSREDYHNLLTASDDIDRALREYQAKEEQASAEAVQGVGRYEKAMQKLREMPRCLNGVKVKQINKIQSEAVQGWIPVEEQPPVFPCLVCDANGNQPSVPLGIVTITDEEHGEWHIDGRLWDTKIFFKGEWCSQTGYGNRIIAWMPLPKPYKGGDDTTGESL